MNPVKCYNNVVKKWGGQIVELADWFSVLVMNGVDIIYSTMKAKKIVTP